MLCAVLLILTLFSTAEAAEQERNANSSENQTAQMYQRYPPSLNTYIRGLLAKISSLQQKNADLRDQISAMQFYCQRADSLQQRLDALDKESSDLNDENESLQKDNENFQKENESLHAQITQGKAQIEALTKQQTKYTAEIQEYVKQINSLKNTPSPQQSQQIAWLNEQIQNQNNKIRDLNSQMSEFNRQNYNLNLAKAIADQQLQDKTKRLDTLEKSYLQSLQEIKEKEAANKGLRQQITQLEEECKKLNK